MLTPEAVVVRSWRRIAYYGSETDCTAEAVATNSGYPVDFVKKVCEILGYTLYK